MNQYRPLNDHVYEYIISLINDGKLSAGDRVSEQMICDAMGVSRTPVREALIKLSDDGYLDNELRKGFRVHGFDAQAAEEVCQIIGPLDAQATCLAAKHFNDADFQQLQFLIDSMELAIAGGLVSKYDELQRSFHDYYMLRCGNERLISLIKQEKRFFLHREQISTTPERARELFGDANHEHQQILNLLKAGKFDELACYMRTVHWSSAHVHLVTW